MIRVIARINPFSDKDAYEIPPERPNILKLNNGEDLTECEFSSIYQDRSNINIYDAEILRLLETEKQYLFAAYGQTDSGKTYTMFGDATSLGILPQAINYFVLNNYPQVDISAVEIYRNKNKSAFYDLLKSRQKVKLSSVDECTFTNLTWARLTKDNIHTILATIKSKRKVESNYENERSSRGHCLVYLKVETQNEQNKPNESKFFCFADLAGYEAPSKKRQSISPKSLKKIKHKKPSEKTLLAEGCEINRNLLSLSMVINQLRSKSSFINYRDSLLTSAFKRFLTTGSTFIACLKASKAVLKYRRNIETVKLAASASEVRVENVNPQVFNQHHNPLVDVIKTVLDDLELVFEQLSNKKDIELANKVRKIIENASHSLSQNGYKDQLETEPTKCSKMTPNYSETSFILRGPLCFKAQAVGDLSDQDSDESDEYVQSNHLAGGSGASYEDRFEHARTSQSADASEAATNHDDLGPVDNDDAMDGDSVKLDGGYEDRIIDFRNLNVEEDIKYIDEIRVSNLIDTRELLNDSEPQNPIRTIYYRTQNRWGIKEMIWVILVSMHFHLGKGKKTDWNRAFEFIKFNRTRESVEAKLKRLKRNPANRVTHALRQKAQDFYEEIFENVPK